MKKIIVILLTAIVLLPQAFADSLSYSIIIDYDNGTLSLKDILLIKASPISASEVGEYTARIISFKGEVIFEIAFNINLEPFYSMPLSKETKSSQKLTKTSFDLVLPYYPNAKKAQILKNNNLLLEIELTKFSSCNENNICELSESLESCPSDCTCGNRICESNENYLACSFDCSSGQEDGVCDKILDGICDPDCNKKDDFDCKRGTSSQSRLLYIGILILLFVILALLIINKRKEKKKVVSGLHRKLK